MEDVLPADVAVGCATAVVAWFGVDDDEDEKEFVGDGGRVEAIRSGLPVRAGQ